MIHHSVGDFPAMMNTSEKAAAYLAAKVDKIVAQYSVTLQNAAPGLRLGDLIDVLAEQAPVVILVDEYDKPPLDNLSSPQVVKIPVLLKGLSCVLKDRNESERFLFVTGVSKFSHLAVLGPE